MDDQKRRSNYFTAGNMILAVVLISLLSIPVITGRYRAQAQRPAGSKLTLANIPFQGERAYDHLKRICDIGGRVSGSEGMRKQQDYLQKHFTSLGGTVEMQEFTARHPETGKPVPMANMIVHWHPEAKERILLCCHYDTRPYPDNDPDPKKREGLFVGANDGASGCALLCEMAEYMQKQPGKYGVDFVLFDGEELIFDAARDKYFLGSEHFAREYVANPPPYRYRWGVLVDMVGDAQLQIYREANSSGWQDTRPLVNDIWETARRLGVREFVNQVGHEIRDDHLALRNIGKIPTCDVIDFDYPTSREQTYWHTTMDVPSKCSALSLAKVGWVVLEWMKKAK